jgi:hypothetical protein
MSIKHTRETWADKDAYDVTARKLVEHVQQELRQVRDNHADPLALRWVIAGLAFSMLVILASGWRYHGAPRPGVTTLVGCLSGLFGGLAQLSGPPVVAYWLSGKETHATMRASIILFFGATTFFAFVSYLAAGTHHGAKPLARSARGACLCRRPLRRLARLRTGQPQDLPPPLAAVDRPLGRQQPAAMIA